jgi:hypothetical protein
VGLGTELLFGASAGVPDPGTQADARPASLGRVAHGKAEFDKATRSFKPYITAKREIPAPNYELPSR